MLWFGLENDLGNSSVNGSENDLGNGFNSLKSSQHFTMYIKYVFEVHIFYFIEIIEIIS